MHTPDPAPHKSTRSLADLLGDLVHESTEVVKGEGRLLRAELSQAGSRVAKGTEMMAAGAIMLLLAAIVLVQALVIVLARTMGPEWASLLVGVVLLLIGAVLIGRGRRHFDPEALAPTRTMAQTRRDLRLTQEQLP